jgi:hypothetical protein
VRDTDSAAALAELRNARKRVRTANIDWVDAMYRAYILTIVGVIAVLVASGYVGDSNVSAQGLVDVHDYAPAVIGLLGAVAMAIGLRSGARGGPLALEAADVRHVLLAPIDRGQALRGAALRQIRHTSLGALAIGAIGGQLAARRLPGNPVAWTACGAAVALLAALAGIGAGYVASGLRWSRWLTNLLALAIVGWSAADLAAGIATSPLDLLGRLALWPLDFDALAAIGIVATLLVLAAGLRVVEGLSIEAAERRSSLIGRLAFAATLQDLRTVLVLQRQLAQEHARRKPWARFVPGARRWPVWGRGWRGVLRWPAVRVVRVFVLASAAGAAAAGIAGGTTPLIVAAGLAMYIAGLDSIEPLAQEVDHPSRTDGYPVVRGAVHVRHLAVSGVVMVVASLAGLGTAFAIRPQLSTLGVGGLTVATAAIGSVAGAAISTIAGPPDQVSAWAIGAPEIAGMHTIARLLWPPALATIGFVPVIVATRLSARHSPTVASTTAVSAGLVFMFEVGMVAWVYAREPVLANIRASFDSMGKAK